MDIGLSVIRQGIPVASVVTARRVGGSLEVPAGEELTVSRGDTVRVTATIDHRGPATSVRLYAAIGDADGGIFGDWDEIWATTGPGVRLPESIDWTTHTLSVDVDVIGGKAGLWDVYVKILETGAPGMPEVIGVIRVGAAEADDEEDGEADEDFVEVQHTIHPFAYTYQGDAETAVFEFRLTPEQIPGTEWLGDRIVDSFIAELSAQGARLLELRVSRDTTPTWWTDYRVEITATVEQGTAGVGAIGFPWTAVIIGVLAILFIIAIVWAIGKIDSILFKRKPGLDDVKPSWGKDTLISAIGDSEEYWERTLTPVETLEAMPEEELRHLLNEIAEEEVPTADLGWAGLAVAGVVGAGLVVAALAFAGRPKK